MPKRWPSARQAIDGPQNVRFPGIEFKRRCTPPLTVLPPKPGANGPRPAMRKVILKLTSPAFDRCARPVAP
jgi:hypothetical protein